MTLGTSLLYKRISTITKKKKQDKNFKVLVFSQNALFVISMNRLTITKIITGMGSTTEITYNMTLNLSVNLENSAVAQDQKRSVFIPNPNKGNVKECSNYCTVEFISHASKIMHKILQVRLQQCVKQELPDVQVGFKNGRGTRS